MQNVKEVLGQRKLDYLVIQHLEPDHSGSIGKIIEEYPDVKLVGSAKMFQMLPQFFDIPESIEKITVAEKGTLELGSHGFL